ncbi:hypothetical protein CWO84_21325 [Methylomonas sp. Kb3]|uniref:hypothetical protein n=1 Tax=Methylomonas sp. Kb3 TaxID=1611544 RepID=UPI000C34DCFB|nr:hypothetical protein [Methylomonas sp. Kb3]PKD37801.1 hypothetical protein CWO84_21325 [Methylomonas sp. Kb3]
MDTRATDSDTVREYYALEHRVVKLETQLEAQTELVKELRQAMKDDKAEVNQAMKDLAAAQQSQATSLVKIESGISSMSKILIYGFPILAAVLSAFWIYNMDIQKKLIPSLQKESVTHEHNTQLVQR